MNRRRLAQEALTAAAAAAAVVVVSAVVVVATMPLAVRRVVVVFAGDGDADQHERIRARRKCNRRAQRLPRWSPARRTSPPRRHLNAIGDPGDPSNSRHCEIPSTQDTQNRFIRSADITVLRPKWSPKFTSQFEAPFASRKIFQLDACVQAAPPRLINKSFGRHTSPCPRREPLALSRTLTLFFLFPPPRLSSFFFLQAAKHSRR